MTTMIEKPIQELPASIAADATVRYVWWDGNRHVPGCRLRYGWTVRLGRHTEPVEKAWLKANGFAFSGGKWGKVDEAATTMTMDTATKIALSIVKGAIERGDHTAYFSIADGHAGATANAVARGWIVAGRGVHPTEGFEMDVYTVTPAGRDAYDRSGVARFDGKAQRRWYGWRWDEATAP